MKRSLDVSQGPGEPQKKKRNVRYDTYKQWLAQFEKDCQSMTWLDCETAIDSGFRVVTKLKCKVCTKFREKIAARRNFNEKWLVGAEYSTVDAYTC